MWHRSTRPGGDPHPAGFFGLLIRNCSIDPGASLSRAPTVSVRSEGGAAGGADDDDDDGRQRHGGAGCTTRYAMGAEELLSLSIAVCVCAGAARTVV